MTAAEKKRPVTYIVPTDWLQQAFDKQMPVLLLPPDWPEGNGPLLRLFVDVVLKGSEGLVRIMQTEGVER